MTKEKHMGYEVDIFASRDTTITDDLILFHFVM